MSTPQTTVESIQQTIVNLVQEAKSETRKWQVAAILLPVLATALLGVATDRWTQELSTRLALTQEYYKQKLAVHEHLHKQMVVVMNSLKGARLIPDTRAQVVDSMNVFYDDYSTAGLYVSPDLLKLLRQFERTAEEIPPLPLYPHSTTASIPELQNVFEKAEKQMVKDLQLAQFNTVR